MHKNTFGKVLFDRCLQLDAVSIMDPEQITLKDLRFFALLNIYYCSLIRENFFYLITRLINGIIDGVLINKIDS